MAQVHSVSDREAAKVVGDAIAICEIPAPTGREHDRARFVLKKLGAIGWSVMTDNVGNVIAQSSPEARRERTLMVAAHLDTVFKTVRSVTVSRDGHLLKAPGIGDNALGVAGLLYLARAFTRKSERRHLTLVATVGEEGLGNLRGATEAVHRLEPAEMIALEGGGLDSLTYSGPASVRARIAVTAPGGHSWEDRDKKSAISELLKVIASLEAAAPSVSDSFNVGRIDGGSGISALAEKAHADVEFRTLRNTQLSEALRVLEEIQVVVRTPLTLSVKILGVRPGGKTSQRHPLVLAARSARADAGLAIAKPSCTSTDANAAMAVGIPSICVGLADSSGAHTLAEQVDVTRLPLGLGALDLLVRSRIAVA